MVMKVICSLNNPQTYYIAPYCTVLPHDVFKETWPPFNKPWEKPSDRTHHGKCRLNVGYPVTAVIIFYSWHHQTFRMKHFLSRCWFIYTDLCLPSLATPAGHTGLWPSWVFKLAVLIMWQDVAITGDPGMTSSVLESFEPIAFWAWNSWTLYQEILSMKCHQAVTWSVHSSDVCGGFQVHMTSCHVTLTYSRSFTVGLLLQENDLIFRLT